MANKVEISPSEWQIMNVVWDKQPVNAAAIIAELKPTKHWTAATIRTFLHRLVKKGALDFEIDGNRYVYRAAIRQTTTVKAASRSFLRSVFSGESGPLISHFVENSKLSETEINELRVLLERKSQQ